MQQRRGTATQWTSANPILASGEIGLETDTNKFKIGNGLATWSSLQYFNDVQDLLELYVPLTQKGANNGVATLGSDGKLTSSQLPTIDELTQDAINTALVAGTGLDKTYDDTANTITIDIDSTVATKTYADTAAGNAQTAAEATAASALSSHESDTTNVHGIVDVAALALTSDVQDLVDYHAGLTTTVHGIADTAQLATKTYADDAVSTHNSDTTNVHGIADTSKLVTNDAASQTISGDVTITGDLVVQGTQTSVNTSSFSLADNMIYLNEAIEYEVTNATGDGTNQTYTTSVDHGITDSMVIRTSWIDPTGYNISSFVPVVSVTANTVTVAGTYSGSYVSGGLLRAKAAVNPDFGISAGYNDGSYHHGGLFRDATDGNWKFFQGYVPEPSGIEIDTADATFDLAPIAVSAITTTDITATGDVDFTAATVTGIDALPSQSTHNGQFLTTDGSTASWATVDALPTQSGNTGKYLTTDGSSATWETVEALPSQTGNNGKYLATDGSTATWSTVEALPSQSGNTGKYLTTDGTTATWATVNATPAIDDLTDVTISTAATNDVVYYNGSGWVNKNVSAIPTTITSVTTGNQAATVHSPLLADAGKIIEMNFSGTNYIEVRANNQQAFPVGTQITILQTGAGQTIVTTNEEAVVINATPGKKLRAQWSSATLIKRATDTWILIGDLTA